MQPWDYWHVNGEGGLSGLFHAREQIMSAGAISGVDSLPPSFLNARLFWVGDAGAKIKRVRVCLFGTSMVGKMRVGIYACPPPAAHSMYPGALIADLGEINLNGSNTPEVVVPTAVELLTGFYYIATISKPESNTEASSYQQSLYGGSGNPLGYASDGIPFVGFGAYVPYGPLPSTFPALPTGAFGYLIATNTGARFYVEATSPGLASAVNVTISYNAGLPSGTTSVTSDTATNITVQWGPNTPAATLAAALEATTNLAVAVSLGTVTNMPNSGSATRTLHPAGPLRQDRAQAPVFLPLLSIEVEA